MRAVTERFVLGLPTSAQGDDCAPGNVKYAVFGILDEKVS